MIAWVIADTGPLVAYLDRGDQDHDWAADLFRESSEPFLTCEAVVTEALFLLHRSGVDHRRLFDLFDCGVLRLSFDLAAELEAVREKMSDYADLPMSLADACLVRMSELNPRAEIITLDRHFKLYRSRDRRVLRLRLPPERKSP